MAQELIRDVREPSEAEVRTKVIVVDDHTMVAEGFARIISSESDFILLGVVGSVADAVALVEKETPDVVLMDYHLPDGDGAQATLDILRLRPTVKVLMLSGSGNGEVLSQAVSAGCAGFLLKNRPAADVVAAIRAAARGELVMRSEELAGVLAHVRAVSSGEGLTQREMEVLRLITKGRSTESIASDLYLSIHTVRNHVRNILLKLGAHSKFQAVAIAVRDGLVGLDEIG